MFDINKCASAVAVAMVGTIHNGDDAKRFAERAIAEGFSNISDLIAADAVKQALALQAAIDKAVPLFNARECRVGKSEPIKFELQGKSVFQEAMEQVDHAIEEVRTASEAFGDSPLAVPSAEAQADTTSTSTTTAIASDVELDSRGLPWDGRIHASTKTRLAKDDSWKLKRNLDPQFVAQVEAELFQVMAIPNVSAPSVTETAPPTPTEGPSIAPPAPTETQGLHPESNAFSVGMVNHLANQGNAAPPAPGVTPQTGASSKDYSTWGMPELMRGMTAKGVDQAYVAQVCQQFGIPSIMAVGARKDLIPLIAETLEL